MVPTPGLLTCMYLHTANSDTKRGKRPETLTTLISVVKITSDANLEEVKKKKNKKNPLAAAAAQQQQ